MVFVAAIILKNENQRTQKRMLQNCCQKQIILELIHTVTYTCYTSSLFSPSILLSSSFHTLSDPPSSFILLHLPPAPSSTSFSLSCSFSLSLCFFFSPSLFLLHFPNHLYPLQLTTHCRRWQLAAAATTSLSPQSPGLFFKKFILLILIFFIIYITNFIIVDIVNDCCVFLC